MWLNVLDGANQVRSIYLSSSARRCGCPRGKGPELWRSRTLGQPASIFACSGLLGTPSPQLPRKTIALLAPMAAAAGRDHTRCAGWQERGGETAGRLGLWCGFRCHEASWGTDPTAGCWLPWQEETEPGLLVTQQSTHERGL